MSVSSSGRRDSERVVLPYEPPYDFPLVLGFLGKRAIPGVEQVDATSYQRVFGPHDKSAWIRVSADPGRPGLILEINGGDKRTRSAATAELVQRTRRMFDLDVQLGPVHAALAVSDLLKTGIARRPGLRVPGSWDGFELAVRAVIGQQVSVAAATTLTRRLVEKYGAIRQGMPVGLDRVFPGPDVLASAALDDIGLPQSRAATLRGLAQAALAGDVDFSADQELQHFVASITRLRGVGPWTAHYVAMRALRNPDAFPAGDLVLQQMLGGEKRLSERATDAASQAWRPWRAYSVLHLWYLAGDRREGKL